MAEEKVPVPSQGTVNEAGGSAGQPGAGGPPQQMQIPVDASRRETAYVNFVQAHINADEIYLDMGTFSQVITPAGPDPIVLTHRLIMNFVTAKRLADLLRRAITQHEQMFGVIELDPQRRLRVPPQAPQPPRPTGS
ncbi:MAG: DUF3467 domain-containing protein [Gemmataceae bacterium]|nr:DUF3467 domain-containing protein [Gemmata sp.]MDW8196746.1 DUF3467 domain-containing protein [Gemmataceae bacterium]